MNDTFLPGSGFDTYESQDKVLMQMDGSTEAAVAVRILRQHPTPAIAGLCRRHQPGRASTYDDYIPLILLTHNDISCQPGLPAGAIVTGGATGITPAAPERQI